MIEKFFPDMMFNSIYDIDLEQLKALGVSGLILDIDNTLVRPDVKKPDETVHAWLDYLRESGFNICILSNSGRKRVTKFTSDLGVMSICHAGKPMRKGFLKALRLMDLEPNQTCMIGDQIFTDVYGAKRIGIVAIYTKPIVFKEIFTVMLKRLPEKIVLHKYDKAKYDKAIRSE